MSQPWNILNLNEGQGSAEAAAVLAQANTLFPDSGATPLAPVAPTTLEVYVVAPAGSSFFDSFEA